MRWRNVLGGAALAVTLVGCTADAPSADSSGSAVAPSSTSDPSTRADSPSSATPTEESTAVPTPSGVGPADPGDPPTSTSAAPSQQPAPPTDAGTGGGTADPEMPRDLVRGVRTMTGMVVADATCNVLVVGTQRVALLGPAAAAAEPGSRVKVEGTGSAVPADCQASSAVTVTRVSPA